MTSPGLKRPFDFELVAQTDDRTSGDGITTDAGIKLENNGPTTLVDPNHEDDTNTLGTKRRCTDTNSHTSPTQNAPDIQQLHSDSIDASMQTEQHQPHPQQQHPQHNNSTSSNPTNRDTPTTPLDEELRDLVRSEVNNSHQHSDLIDPLSNGDEQIILTTRQLSSICAKLISVREKKLRDEYDRRLASKLAEQYDLFAKANYLNSIAEPSRATTPSLTTTPTPTTAVTANHPSLTNAIAAALMQRSTPDQVVPPACSPNQAPSAAASMSNLTSIAASLTADGHHGTLPSTHHLAAYSLQQQQAAATATAIRIAQQQQQQQQQRISIPMVPANGLIPSGPVLLTSNLDEQLATPEALFTLFGVFGDVIRVKILFNKKDNALIQMADASRAQVAQSYLDKQRIFGKVIRVTRSRHQIVQMPRDGGQSDAGLTKDFTNSPLHRFKIPGSRNYLNIYPPSNTLHVSNIPPTVDESDLHKAFVSQCGFEFTSFKFFPKDRKMALMKFNSVEHATIALIKMHNYQISDENNLRVSFSKSAL